MGYLVRPKGNLSLPLSLSLSLWCCPSRSRWEQVCRCVRSPARRSAPRDVRSDVSTQGLSAWHCVGVSKSRGRAVGGPSLGLLCNSGYTCTVLVSQKKRNVISDTPIQPATVLTPRARTWPVSGVRLLVDARVLVALPGLSGAAPGPVHSCRCAPWSRGGVAFRRMLLLHCVESRTRNRHRSGPDVRRQRICAITKRASRVRRRGTLHHLGR